MPSESPRTAIPLPGASGQHGQSRSWAKLPPGCFIKACRTSAVGRTCVTAHGRWRSHPGRWACGGFRDVVVHGESPTLPNKHGRAHDARDGASQRQELKQSDVRAAGRDWPPESMLTEGGVEMGAKVEGGPDSAARMRTLQKMEENAPRSCGRTSQWACTLQKEGRETDCPVCLTLRLPDRV